MSLVPPYLVRRVVVAPLFVLASIGLFAALPLWIIAAAFASRFVPGRWRPLRVAWFLFVYLALETLVLTLLLVLWIAFGFGWKIRSRRATDLHYRLAARWLRLVIGSARRTFKLVIEAENDIELRPDRSILVFARHAGPGDSFLLVNALANGLDRRPRIILKDVLQLDPCVDVLLNRLPNRFIPSGGGAHDAVVASIAELSSNMGPSGALVLFPEGGNFTPRRRRRAIEKLANTAQPEFAERAEVIQHLLPPRVTGALTAMDAAPEADVLFVGHVGLERLTTVGDLWRGIPMDSAVATRTWLVRAEDIPPPAAQAHWLYDQWAMIDRWIDTRK